MQDYNIAFDSPIGIILVLIVIIWMILMLLAPFFWYGTNMRAKEISKKMDTLIAIQRRALERVAEPKWE